LTNEKGTPVVVQPIDKEKYDVGIQYYGRIDGWLVDIKTTDDLVAAIRDTSIAGSTYVRILARVVVKAAAAPPESEATPRKADVNHAVQNLSSRSRQSGSSAAVVKPSPIKKAQVVKHVVDRSNRPSPTEQKILSAMSELRSFNILTPPRNLVALFSGFTTASSPGFAKPLINLKRKGFIHYPKGKMVALTRTGVVVAGDVDPPSGNRQVQDRIKGLLTPTSKKLFDVLSDGRDWTLEDLAAATGHSSIKSKRFAVGLKAMSSIGIVEFPVVTYPSSGAKKTLVCLTDIAFPFGRDADGMVLSEDESSG